MSPEESRRTSKMSMEGWWMVQTTVRPVLTVLRTVRITIAAARASSPVHSNIRFALTGSCKLFVRPPLHLSSARP